MPFFNPRPRIERVALANGQACFVIDDALVEPERLVEFASAQRDAFRNVDFNAYPGIYLIAQDELSAGLNGFFAQHLRRQFDARRTLQLHCRFSMVTLSPHALRPRQWLCHRDSGGVEPRQSIQASILYLFKDESLGGTSFYEPACSAEEMARLLQDSSALSAQDFTQKYSIELGYMIGSNRYFTRIGSVPAKWNRLIFYDGTILHSGDILSPDKLSADPGRGRLTLNGFFTSRRHAV